MIHECFRVQLQEALDLEGGAFTLADVEASLADSRVQLWQSDTGVLITEVHDAPRLRVLNFWLAAGDLEEVLLLSDAALEWGRELGCKQATFTGRRGWEKVLSRRGWTSRLVTMGRTI